MCISMPGLMAPEELIPNTLLVKIIRYIFFLGMDSYEI